MKYFNFGPDGTVVFLRSGAERKGHLGVGVQSTSYRLFFSLIANCPEPLLRRVAYKLNKSNK